LHEASTLVAALLERMRSLAERTRQEGDSLSIRLRQAERQLDEAVVRHRAAVERKTPTAPQLKRRQAELREERDGVAHGLHANQHALRQLEQLIRQIEMSSSALTGGDETTTADPWMLALRAQVIQGREQERQRLAREVHDGPAQVLANSLMILETCYGVAQQIEHEKLLTMLGRMRTAVKDGLADVRRFIADLRPGRLDEQGLSGAIADLVRRYTDAYAARVSLEADLLPRLPHEVEIVLYRIAQESLQNAYKYARDAPIAIRLAQASDTIRLVVRDEGPGFDPREVARRAGRTNWGLTSMRERAELIGAEFTVASRPGQGTEVTVSLTLRT
jgi:two-component system sensor histidine kinase DegS